MLDFTIDTQNFMILFGSFVAFLAFVFGVSKAVGLLKDFL